MTSRCDSVTVKLTVGAARMIRWCRRRAARARGGVQNIAEGSQMSGTSRKMEIKLTNVARASLEELRRDYEDFLRQRGLEKWPPEHPILKRLKARRCATLEHVRVWVKDECQRAGVKTDKHGPTPKESTASVAAREIPSVFSAQLVANAALSLLNVACYLLKRQLEAQATAFEKEGGFTERLYRIRKAKKQG
jgi:four helix bundle suffix protein